MFYSKLIDTHMSDEDYCHDKTAWGVLNCKNIKEYHDKYNQTDVLLLAG